MLSSWQTVAASRLGPLALPGRDTDTMLRQSVGLRERFDRYDAPVCERRMLRLESSARATASGRAPVGVPMRRIMSFLTPSSDSGTAKEEAAARGCEGRG